MDKLHPSIRDKIERADKHILELDAAIEAFCKTNPCKIKAGFSSDKRATYFVADIESIPLVVRAIAGDAIQNLRSALDYLACLLWNRTNTGDCRIYFPIFDSAAEYEARAFGKVKGLAQDAIDAISAVQPYKGGSGIWLWQLHKLSVIDKHRLPLTVAAGNLGIHLPSLIPRCSRQQRKQTPGYWV